MKQPFVFDFVRCDTWGNDMVHCPVCAWTFKLDGVRKHVLRKVQQHDPKHTQWFEKNRWKFGTRDPAHARIGRP